MKQALHKKMKLVVALVFAAMLMFTAFYSGMSFTVYAAMSDVVAAFESRSVLADLEGATINGKPFDIEDYPQDEKSEPQVISFIEFGFAASDDRPDLGYYVYVYNPQQLIFNESAQNKIQLRYGSKELHDKYHLEILNYTTAPGYEGRFYKFRIAFTAAQLADIQAQVDEAERVYEVTGIELVNGRAVTEYKCLQKFTYTGYAEGYGIKATDESTLTCTADGIDRYLELDVHSTQFRPDGTNGKDMVTQDSLNSVYFAIPRELYDEYGVLTRIRGEYLKALTTPIFVTGNEEFYTELLAYVGKDVGYFWPQKDESRIILLGFEYRQGGGPADYVGTWAAYNYPLPKGYTIDEGLTEEEDIEATKKACAEKGLSFLTRLNYVLAATNESGKFVTDAADTYEVSSEELLAYMRWYTQKVAGKNEEIVGGEFASSLFEWIDNDMTMFDFDSYSKTKTLHGETIKQTWWEMIGGKTHIANELTYGSMEVIHEVTDDDFVVNPATGKVLEKATSEKLLIGASDAQDLKDYYDEHKEDYVVYLVRYATDDYKWTEVREGHFNGYTTPAFGHDAYFTFADGDTNAYFAQEYMYLNFDIIDVTLTKNDVDTAIPVIMSPINILPKLTYRSNTTSDKSGGLSILEIILIILAVILVLVILMPLISPLLPSIGKGVADVVTFPFKLFGGGKKSDKGKRRKGSHDEGSISPGTTIIVSAKGETEIKQGGKKHGSSSNRKRKG